MIQFNYRLLGIENKIFLNQSQNSLTQLSFCAIPKNSHAQTNLKTAQPN